MLCISIIVIALGRWPNYIIRLRHLVTIYNVISSICSIIFNHLLSLLFIRLGLLISVMLKLLLVLLGLLLLLLLFLSILII
jgi:hypothetical protein